MSLDTRSADAAIAELARRQYGVVHRRQLFERQLTARQIDHRLTTGVLIDLGHSVYAVPSAPATFLRQFKAAELAIAGAVICGLAAAVLHELGATGSAAPEIAVPPGASSRCTFARVHRRRELEVVTVHRMRVTSVAQTLVDIAGRTRVGVLEDTWTSALVRKRVSLDDLATHVERAGAQRLRHRGLARSMLDSLVVGAGVADSELEIRLLDLLASMPDLPAVVPQLPLEFWAGGRGRADAGIPDWKLLLEVDGRSWHARLRDFDSDRERDNLAVANGYVVLRFTALHLREDPARVVELIRLTGASREELLARRP